MQDDRELITRLAAPVPRYTSYPTANHFSPAIGTTQYVDWLANLDPDAPLSLYLHIPYCHALCWYCACNTKAVQRYEPIRRYVDVLVEEIANVSSVLAMRPAAAHLHWGGGSPSMLESDDIARITEALGCAFRIDKEAEHAVEIDPRRLSESQVAAFARAGVNRVSLGVQDFDPAVQAAIGRLQSLDLTRRAIEMFRSTGVRSVNIDLVYGLPFQTQASLATTLEDVVALGPDRISAFGYAHLPQRVKNQRLIDASALPGPLERFEQSRLIGNALEAAGYRRIGLDHFSKTDDTLASQALHRNFQGYTSDSASSLIGFGASAIGRLPEGFVQNAVPAHEYERLVREEGVAVARGIALSEDDRVRAYVIERLMCDFRFSAKALVERFGSIARPVLADAAHLVGNDDDGLVCVTDDGIEVTERGRPFVRTICAGFDSYLSRQAGTHSTAV